MEKIGQEKTREDVLNQIYIDAKDLKILIPNLGQGKCLKYIKDMQEEMREKNMFIPDTHTYLAHIKLVKKKFNL